MSRSNFKGGPKSPSAGKSYPHDGQRILDPAEPTADPMAKVPDYPIASVDRSGMTPSFTPPLAYPAPPSPRKPFKVS